jgi:hypothetical protein
VARFTLRKYTGSESRTETVSGVTWRRYTILKNGVGCEKIPYVWACDKKEATEFLRGLVADGHTR